MNQHEMLTKIETLIEESKVGLLATTDQENRPRVRWMTPTIIPNRGPSIFAFTPEDAMKIIDIKYQPEVKWLIQLADLSEVVSARGETNILNNPALKSEILEVLIPQSTRLWNIDISNQEMVILESVIRDATYYLPKDYYQETVTFE